MANEERFDAYAPPRSEERPEDSNPFALTIKETLVRLRAAATAESWNIPDGTYLRLADTAPTWPQGHLAFRSLRIRFGNGLEGVQRTFDTHVKCIKGVFGEECEFLLPSTSPRLAPGRNRYHRPCLEWVIFDLQPDPVHGRQAPLDGWQQRAGRLLADEGLAFVWLFPEYARSIVQQLDTKRPGFFLGGYAPPYPGFDEPNPHVQHGSWAYCITNGSGRTRMWNVANPGPQICLSVDVLQHFSVNRVFSTPLIRGPRRQEILARARSLFRR